MSHRNGILIFPVWWMKPGFLEFSREEILSPKSKCEFTGIDDAAFGGAFWFCTKQLSISLLRKADAYSIETVTIQVRGFVILPVLTLMVQK